MRLLKEWVLITTVLILPVSFVMKTIRFFGCTLCVLCALPMLQENKAFSCSTALLYASCWYRIKSSPAITIM